MRRVEGRKHRRGIPRLPEKKIGELHNPRAKDNYWRQVGTPITRDPGRMPGWRVARRRFESAEKKKVKGGLALGSEQFGAAMRALLPERAIRGGYGQEKLRGRDTVTLRVFFLFHMCASAWACAGKTFAC